MRLGTSIAAAKCGDWGTYVAKLRALEKRGVRIGDVLTCDDGATPQPHNHTGRLCVRVSLYDIIEGPEPRFFVHGYRMGLTAYVPEYYATHSIPAGTKLKVTAVAEHSCTLRRADAP